MTREELSSRSSIQQRLSVSGAVVVDCRPYTCFGEANDTQRNALTESSYSSAIADDARSELSDDVELLDSSQVMEILG